MIKKYFDAVDFTFNRGFDRKKSVQNHFRKIVSLSIDADLNQKVICNSIPKSGTHLLEKILNNCTSLKASGFFFSAQQRARKLKDFDDYKYKMSKIKKGYYFGTHMPFSIENEKVLKELKVLKILLIRNPKDIFISQFHHTIDRDTNIGHRIVGKQKSRIDGFKLLAKGFESDVLDRGKPLLVPPFTDKYKSYTRWDSDDTLVLRYEDLVGVNGGGTLESQVSAINNLLAFIDDPIRKVDNNSDFSSVLYDKKSNTFRKGKINSWQESLEPVEIDFIESTIGDLGAKYGY